MYSWPKLEKHTFLNWVYNQKYFLNEVSIIELCSSEIIYHYSEGTIGVKFFMFRGL